MPETTTLTLSDAMKTHLHEIKSDQGDYAVDDVSTLHNALQHIIDNPYETEITIGGYDETLDEPIKVPKQLHKQVKELKEEFGARDYEETVRTQANIEQRDMGEQPVETEWPPEE